MRYDTINLTNKAVSRLSQLAARSQNKKFLLALKWSNCNKFLYLLRQYDSSKRHWKTNYKFYENKDIKIYIPGTTISYIHGTTIDYVYSTIGDHFTFDNPNATSVCCCGRAFLPSSDLVCY
mgnify:CR=1 FL=1